MTSRKPKRSTIRRLLSLTLAATPVAAHAKPQTFPLTPATTKLAMTVYAVGIFPLPGGYPSFRGTLELDAEKPGFCRVSITIDQASLVMSDPDRVRTALGPDMLDAKAFPTMHFDGECQGKMTVGHLTLHGITRPLSLSMRRAGDSVVGEARIQRRDYAINGMPHLLGQMIKIRFSTTLPML